MDRIVLSPRYLKELSSVPEEVLSLREPISQVNYRNHVIFHDSNMYDKHGSDTKLIVASLQLPIKEEPDFWLTKIILSQAPSTSPINVTAYQAILPIVTRVTSRVFVETLKSRDQKWLDTAANYTMDAFKVSSDLRPYHAFLRPFVAPWMSSTKRLNGHVQAVKDCFGDIITQRLSEHGTQEQNDGDNLF